LLGVTSIDVFCLQEAIRTLLLDARFITFIEM